MVWVVDVDVAVDVGDNGWFVGVMMCVDVNGDVDGGSWMWVWICI